MKYIISIFIILLSITTSYAEELKIKVIGPNTLKSLSVTNKPDSFGMIIPLFEDHKDVYKFEKFAQDNLEFKVTGTYLYPNSYIVITKDPYLEYSANVFLIDEWYLDRPNGGKYKIGDIVYRRADLQRMVIVGFDYSNTIIEGSMETNPSRILYECLYYHEDLPKRPKYEEWLLQDNKE